MPKKELTGTLDEQCDFLYELAQEKIVTGNYTGAAYALAEIVKHKPDYRDAAKLLAAVRQRKASQTYRLVISLLGAIAFVGIGSLTGLRNDLLLLALAAVGLLVGYGLANLWSSFRHA